ncbi:MAG: DNA mismatch repair protein MutT [Paludibacter sp.]|nr:MAG: DNA mismatch repair protein MutT [Paludibacter sp.]
MNFQEKFQFCPVCGSKNFIKNNIKSKKCQDCGFVYYLNPSAATAVFIRNEQGELLVCRRVNNPAKGTLDLVGGFIDCDETAEQGIIREIKEETGLDVGTVRYLFSIPNDYLFSDLNIPTMDLFFETTVKKDVEIIPADDVSEAFFVPLKDVDYSLFGLKSIKKAVQFYLESNQFNKTK